MARPNWMKSRWTAGETAFGGWCTTGSPFAAEVMALEGFDYVCLDLQHGLFGFDSFLSGMYALARTRATPVVRVPSVDSELIGKVLDAGAEAVIVPMVETAEQAARAVAGCRYYPQGNRSTGLNRAAATLGSDPAFINEQVVCLVMIETAVGVENAAEICAVPGIDGIYVGPGDLALTLGLPATLKLTPGPLADAVYAVRDACVKAGIVAGIQCHSAEDALARAEAGFTMVTVTTDAHQLRSGLRLQVELLGRQANGETGAYG
jgi:4-hydroxy-2-oxoheptanedioate aldolase